MRVNASLSEMLPRANSSLEAVTVFVLTQQPRCYWLEVYDWEAGGGVGRIPVPLETTDLESGRSCDIIEDGSNRMSEGSVISAHMLHIGLSCVMHYHTVR